MARFPGNAAMRCAGTAAARRGRLVPGALLAVAAACGLAAAGVIPAGAAEFRLYDLGTLGGAESYATAINDSGQIVGWSELPAGEQAIHAFLYDGTMHDLGTLGGTYSEAWDINAAGVAVGFSATAGDAAARAFLYDGTMHALPTLGGTQSYATAVNDAGQVAGWSTTAGDAAAHAFLYDGTMHDLGTLGGSGSWAQGINEQGHVVGWSYVDGDAAVHAFLYDGTMHDLGTYGGTHSEAWSLDALGRLVGSSRGPGDTPSQAMRYDGAWHSLGTLGGQSSAAYGLNDAEQIVGASQIASRDAWHAFYYDGAMQDLGTLGGTSSEAYAVNGTRRVVGWSQVAGDAARHAFLAAPLPITLVFQGTTSPWGRRVWSLDGNLVEPAGGEDMSVGSGEVVVDQPVTGDAAPASLTVEGGAVGVGPTGALDVAGEVVVGQGAELAVDGPLAASEITVEGTLHGSGTIAAPLVVVGGRLAPGGAEEPVGGLGGGAALARADGRPGAGSPASPPQHAGAEVPEPAAWRCAALAVLSALGWLVAAGARRFRAPAAVKATR